jgi:hypothetical protein
MVLTLKIPFCLRNGGSTFLENTDNDLPDYMPSHPRRHLFSTCSNIQVPLVDVMCFCLFSGFETARSLALHGCTVVFACRDLSRTQAAIARIKEERPNATCDVIELDLARLHSVTNFVAHFKDRYK